MGKPITSAEIDSLKVSKQDSLPTVVNDKYLHTNAETGTLEWSDAQGGGSSTWGQITGTLSDQTDLQTVLNTKADVPIVITGTLTAGQTSITLSNAGITTSSIIDVYTDTYGIAPKTVEASTGQVVLTFKAQETDLGVRVEVR